MRKPTNALDLIGHRFGKLTVTGLHPAYLYGKIRAWDCLCECGGVLAVSTGNLRSGNTTSCGCYREVFIKNKPSRHPLFKTYSAMIARCSNPANNQFHNYGGRGIKVCDRWLGDFFAFATDMGERPEGMTLDRIDGNGNYEPSNCRWATDVDQANNSRRNRKIEFNGEIKTATQWARIYGIKPNILYQRLDRDGWTIERALATPHLEIKE